MDRTPNHSKKRKIAEINWSLPEDIIHAILSRLPVKSLLKFRCVSKSWCFLISSKPFIRTHLANSTENTDLTHQSVFSNCGEEDFNLKQCSLHSLLYEPSSIDVVDIKLPISSSQYSEYSNYSFVGCCNGLCCIVAGVDFYLWNPSTRKSWKLPDIVIDVDYFNICLQGFGFDESNDDCKVLFTGYFDSSMDTANIYSLKTNSWKTSKNFIDGAPIDSSGTFVNGKLHWGLVSKADGVRNKRLNIVSFDLGSEELGVLEPPSDANNDSYSFYSHSLGVLGGCLCVSYENQLTYNTDVLVLKQYGVEDSWDKVLSVPGLDYYESYFYDKAILPLCISAEGEILFSRRSEYFYSGPSEFFIYNPKTKTKKRVEKVNNFAVVYVQSLVSPIPDGEP